MTVRIFHTADLHLGMKFVHGYPPPIQKKLVRARYDALGRALALANKHKCHIFLVAGDLFDSHQLSAKDIHTAVETLNQFEGSLVVIMPGNHDYIQPSSELWARFSSKAGSCVLLMDKPVPYDLRRYELNLVVYPAPCTSRLSPENAIGWIKACPKVSGETFRIGVAHGSVKGISPDFNEQYYPMTQEELRSLGLDLWLMGHTHVRYPDVEQGTEERILFPATPEPDGFDRIHLGYAWIVDLGDGHSFRYRSIQTGKYRFIDRHVTLSGEDDLENLKSEFKKLKTDNALVRLQLTGRLPSDVLERLDDLRQALEKRVLYLLKFDRTGLHQAVTVEDIDREFTRGSFPHRLLKALIEEGADPLAVQTAYDLTKEARQ